MRRPSSVLIHATPLRFPCASRGRRGPSSYLLLMVGCSRMETSSSGLKPCEGDQQRNHAFKRRTGPLVRCPRSSRMLLGLSLPSCHCGNDEQVVIRHFAARSCFHYLNSDEVVLTLLSEWCLHNPAAEIGATNTLHNPAHTCCPSMSMIVENGDSFGVD